MNCSPKVLPLKCFIRFKCSYSKCSQLIMLHLYGYVYNSYLSPCPPTSSSKSRILPRAKEWDRVPQSPYWRKPWSLLRKKGAGGSTKKLSVGRKQMTWVKYLDSLSNNKPEEIVGWVRKKVRWKDLQSLCKQPNRSECAWVWVPGSWMPFECEKMDCWKILKTKEIHAFESFWPFCNL